MIGGRLRTGELLASLGLLGLLATLFLDLFSADPASVCEAGRGVHGDACRVLMSSAPSPHVDGGWGVLGHPWLELVAVAALWLLAVLVLAVRARPGRPTYGAVVSIVLGVFVLGLVLLLTAIRVLLARPHATMPHFADAPPLAVDAGVAAGGWLLLASLLLGLVGLWVAMADDRPRARESAVTPPPARPAPSRRDAPTAAAEPGA